MILINEGDTIPTDARLIESAALRRGPGTLPYARTIAFTTLMLFQIFKVINARSDEQRAFVHLFSNVWLWAAMAGSLALQVIVVNTPFLQRAFGTGALSVEDWIFCTAVASSMRWLRELANSSHARAAAGRWKTRPEGPRAESERVALTHCHSSAAR